MIYGDYIFRHVRLSRPITIPDSSLHSACTPAALEDKKVFLSPPYHEYFIGLICSNYWNSTQCIRLITRRKKSRLINLTDTVYFIFFQYYCQKQVANCQLKLIKRNDKNHSQRTFEARRSTLSNYVKKKEKKKEKKEEKRNQFLTSAREFLAVWNFLKVIEK